MQKEAAKCKKKKGVVLLPNIASVGFFFFLNLFGELFQDDHSVTLHTAGCIMWHYITHMTNKLQIQKLTDITHSLHISAVKNSTCAGSLFV